VKKIFPAYSSAEIIKKSHFYTSMITNVLLLFNDSRCTSAWYSSVVLFAGSGPVQLSMTTSPCREPHCTNLASSFIYPYCYEHIDRKIVETMTAQRQQRMTSAPPGYF